jgi:hypothetical protein
MNYPDLVATLPVPTPEQTDQFAEHVADNHSWYKHLPFFPPGAKFILFPNPHAGRVVNLEVGRFVVHDLDQGDYFRHHSKLSTAVYREKFGYWDYWVDDNPRVTDPVEGPWIYGLEDGGRELVPEQFKQAWSCRFTAFLKAAPLFGHPEKKLARDQELFSVHALLHPDDPDLARYQGMIESLPKNGGDTKVALELFRFMQTEVNEQRNRLQATLRRVREAWMQLRANRKESEV